MARSYGMVVFIENYNPGNADMIKQAVEDSWDLECPIESWRDQGDGVVEAYGCCSLYANDRPADFVSRLAESVWTANHAYCDIGVVVVPEGGRAEDNVTCRTTLADYRSWLLTGELPYVGDKRSSSAVVAYAA